MTMGKDVSMLFADVLNCMQTENMELKKLVYLYLTNYASAEPDLAILAVIHSSKFVFYHKSLEAKKFYRILKITILLFAPLLSEQWAAFGSRRSPNICVILYTSPYR